MILVLVSIKYFLSLLNTNHNPLTVPAPHPSPGKSPEAGPDSALSPAQDLTIFVMPPGKAGCGPHLDPAKVTYTRDTLDGTVQLDLNDNNEHNIRLRTCPRRSAPAPCTASCGSPCSSWWTRRGTRGRCSSC